MTMTKGLILSSFFLILFLNAPGILHTASSAVDTSAGQTIESKGLVPCGTSGKPACQPCDLLTLAKNITDYIVYIGFSITTLMIGVGGIMIFAGAYSEKQIETGKEILRNAIIGLLIILFAWLIVDTIIKVLVSDYTVLDVTRANAGAFKNFGPWNNFQCINP